MYRVRIVITNDNSLLHSKLPKDVVHVATVAAFPDEAKAIEYAEETAVLHRSMKRAHLALDRMHPIVDDRRK